MNYKIFLLSCVLLCGCTTLMAPKKVVLLPEERIYTLPAGQEISVLLDGKPLKMTFPEDMKIVSSTTLVRQESRLNDALFKKIKSDSDKKKLLGILGSLSGALMFGLALALKSKIRLPKKVTISGD